MSMLDIKEGNCLKGYCTQCRAESNNQEDWKVNWVGEFYCQDHLKELYKPITRESLLSKLRKILEREGTAKRLATRFEPVGD